jgi:hypothetical protein
LGDYYVADERVLAIVLPGHEKVQVGGQVSGQEPGREHVAVAVSLIVDYM